MLTFMQLLNCNKRFKCPYKYKRKYHNNNTKRILNGRNNCDRNVKLNRIKSSHPIKKSLM